MHDLVLNNPLQQGMMRYVQLLLLLAMLIYSIFSTVLLLLAHVTHDE